MTRYERWIDRGTGHVINAAGPFFCMLGTKIWEPFGVLMHLRSESNEMEGERDGFNG
jgi:hypothetical protein